MAWCRSRATFPLLLMGASLAAVVRLAAQTVADGVYSADQAERGRRQYESTCQQCHGATLAGGVGQALVGEAFIRNWSGVTLGDLVERVRSMPPDSPAHLDERSYLDLTAYVLQANGFPAGPAELSAGALDAVIQPAGGPQDVPEFALVQIVGCLARAPDDAWLVTDAGEPVRTKNPDPSTGAEQSTAAAKALGTATFRLLYLYPSPDRLAGHKVEAKGFLLRNPTEALNVTGLASLAETCER